MTTRHMTIDTSPLLSPSTTQFNAQLHYYGRGQPHAHTVTSAGLDQVSNVVCVYSVCINVVCVLMYIVCVLMYIVCINVYSVCINVYCVCINV